MQNLVLTKDGILKDIEGYNQRIEGARLKLSALPVTADTWKVRKKVKDQQRILTDEIAHVKRLLWYAREALKETQNEYSCN